MASALLADNEAPGGCLPFALRLEQEGCAEHLVAASQLETMQLNITSRCNLQCRHCHIEAGPSRFDEMDRATMDAALDVFAGGGFGTLDITGGAPELNESYERLVTEGAARAKRVMTRTNLVVLTLPQHRHLPALWAELGVEVVCSLPHYEQRNTERQRGPAVFEAAIEGLKALNAQGYGLVSGKVLNIVSNPGGAFLPPAQAAAEREFRTRLSERHGVCFDHLLTITNNPVGRFGGFLEDKGILSDYLARLYASFNPQAAAGIMCRTQVSVAPDGRLYDCDFNQAAGLPLRFERGDLLIQDVAQRMAQNGATAGMALLAGRSIRVGQHCYACTAGAGSSCGGATA
ncbi:MAG: arsenosugar biosynthesis radical SAM protein ArsS [Coriobacteriales bacterium]|jgi:radical SAM/Cys-rich protein|nr:arsenosugar biosynthesis radical SAM protein ArsS [Coriobacteriales bacterium]